MKASSTVPAATGTVTVEKDKDNGNTKLKIQVNHLASPSSLNPAANTYLVWVLPSGGGTAVKQGAIRVDKDLKGELRVVTVSKEFDLFVTAEQNEGVLEPLGVRILDTHVNLR
ncbi:MAG: hypothetical protein ACR2IV_20895 [Bryobacteraceae bacterium]